MKGRISKEALSFLREISRRIEKIKKMLITSLESYSVFLGAYFNFHRNMMDYIEKIGSVAFYSEMTLETAKKSIIDEEYLSFLQDYLDAVVGEEKNIEKAGREIKRSLKVLLKSLKSLKRSLENLKEVKTLFKGLERRGKILRKRKIGEELILEIQKLRSVLTFFCERFARDTSDYLDIFEGKITTLYKTYLAMEKEIIELLNEIKTIYKYAKGKKVDILRRLDEKIYSINSRLLNKERELLNLSRNLVKNAEKLVKRKFPNIYFITEEFRMAYEKITKDFEETLKKIEILLKKEELARKIIERKYESFAYFNERFKEFLRKGREDITNYFNAIIASLEILYKTLEETTKENLEDTARIIEGLLNFGIENVVKELVKYLREYKKRVLDIVGTIEGEVVYEIQRDLEFFGEIVRILKEKRYGDMDLGGYLFILERKFDVSFERKDYVEISEYYKKIIKNLRRCVGEVRRNVREIKRELGKEVRDLLIYIIKKLDEIFGDIEKIERELGILHRYLKRKIEKGKIEEKMIRNRIKLFLSKLQRIVEKADERSLEIGDIKLFIKDISQILDNCKGKIYKKIEFSGVCKRYYNFLTKSLENSFEELKKSLEEMHKLMYSVNLSIVGLRHHLKSE